ncbi:MAG: thioredoxin [Bacteroidetes bacterium]|nr:thioredoxin [Bacteroidota bacterium]
MKNTLLFLFSAFIICVFSCSESQTQQAKTLLPASEFSSLLQKTSGEIVVDVRTPGEYQGGHLAEAVNIDFNDGGFQQNISKLDKSKEYFVYCLSGGRSAAAAEMMRSMGFAKVYELDGGMIAWRSANLPETTDQPKPMKTGMNQQEFLKSLEGNTPVLVDFYAEWCKPCKQMQPFLEKLEKDMAGKVIIKRIDADQNTALLQSMGIEGIPYLILHDGKKVVWNHMGFIDETNLRKEITSLISINH